MPRRDIGVAGFNRRRALTTTDTHERGQLMTQPVAPREQHGTADDTPCRSLLERRAQGLPDVITDETVLDLVARIVIAASTDRPRTTAVSRRRGA